MNDTEHPTEQDNFWVIHIRRRPFTSCMMWLLWFLALMILFEFALTSFAEYEPQAGVVAGALFAGLLFAGIIVEIVRITEKRSQYRDLASDYENTSDSGSTL